MSDTNTVKRSSIGRKLLWALGIFVVLLVVLYFVVTSAAFLKGFILPRVSKSVGANITVADASIHPFSSVTLDKLKVQPPHAEPILEADQVIARYSLMDILRGKINVSEIAVSSPIIQVVQNEKGEKNTDAVTKGGEKKPEAKKEEKPPQIDIRNVSLKNATVRMAKKNKDGTEELTEISGLNLGIDHLANGRSGKMDVAAAIRMSATTNQLDAALSGTFEYALGQNLTPDMVKGNLQTQVKQASGIYGDLAGLNATMTSDLSPTELKEVALRFSKGGSALGDIRVSGPFDSSKVEGKLKVEVNSIDRQVLNLVGGSMGIDFGPTKLNSSNTIELTKGGKAIAVDGTLNANSLSITKDKQTTPALNLQANYSVSLDQVASNAVIKAFTLNGTQQGRPLLQAALSKPMKLDFAKAEGGVEESDFELTVTDLNLADWKAFAADLNPTGKLGLKTAVVSKSAGKAIAFDLTSQGSNLGATVSSNKIEQVNLQLTTRGTLTDLDKLNLETARLQVSRRNESVADISASGRYALTNGEADLKAEIAANLAEAVKFVVISNVSVAAGDLKLNSHVTQTGKTAMGQKLQFDLASQITGLTAKVSSNTIDRADIQLETKGALDNGDKLSLENARVQLAQRGEPAMTATASGTYALKAKDADLKATLEAALPKVLQLVSMPNVSASSGTFKFDGTVKMAGEANQTVAGKATVADFTGHYADYRFNQFNTAFDLDVLKQADVTQLRRVVATFKQGNNAAGDMEITGNLDSKKQTGQFDVKLDNLNQHLLKPVLQPSLGTKDLLSVLINGTASATLNSTNSAAYKADLVITNLVVKDASKPKAEEPLSARFSADVGMARQVYDLRQVRLGLSPTARAQNEVQVKGQVDMSDTNALKGKIAVTADSIDITPWYDLYAGATNQTAAAKPAAAPATAPAQTNANKEPGRMKLPVSDFTADVAVGKFFLREIAINNLQATAAVKNNHVTVNPAQLVLNGAPVKANLTADVGVPGYTYDLTLSADRIPLEPIANSFIPDKRGQYQGQIIANAVVKGAGVTGVNLKKNLNGNINFAFTNANIHIVGPKTKALLTPIAIVLRIPEITESPLNWIDAKVQLGNGNINLSECKVVSAAFMADTSGVIPIADVFTNSPLGKMPVNFALARSLAQRANLMPANTPTNATYVPLPTFVTVKGTIGDPKSDVNKVVITGLLAKSASGLVGGKAGGILKGIGGIVTGQPAQQTPATNAPAQAVQSPQRQTNTAAPLVNEVFDLFKKKKKK